MLQSMRHLAHSWIFKGLMAFLVLSFGIWGIGDIFRGNPLHRTVAKVGDHAITVQDVGQEFQRELSAARSNYMPDLTAAKAKELGLLTKSVDALIERALRDQATQDLGIKISLHAALEQLSQDAAFKDKNGKFDRSSFDRFLKEGRFTEHDLIAGTSHEMLQSAIVSLPVLPDLVSDNLYKARGQKRILEIIDIAPTAETKEKPSEQDVQSYYEAHTKAFTLPEQRKLTLASLSLDDVAKDIIITDEQLKKAYDEDSASITKPEQRDLIQAIVQDEGKAKNLAEKASSSGSLRQAAKDMGLNTINLDKMEEQGLPTELASPVFSLNEKGITPAVKSSLGWHVVQVDKIHPSYKPELKTIANELRKKMQTDRAADLIGNIVNKLDDKLAAGNSLENIAQDIKLTIQSLDNLDSTGKQPDGHTPLADNPNSKSILQYGFSQQTGESSSVIDDRAGHYVVVRTDNITPSAAEPLDHARDRVIQAIKSEAQSKQTAARAEEIEKAIKNGTSMSSLAAQKGISVRFSKPISEVGDTDDSLPANLFGQILSLKKGDTLTTNKGDHHLVLRVAEIKDVADSQDSNEIKGQLKTQIAMAAQNEAMFQYMNHLRRHYHVAIDQDALAGVAQTDNQ